MIIVSTTEFAKNLKAMLDSLEYRGEEIILTRSKHKIARIMPGSPHLTAIQAMGDLHRTLPEDAAADWAADSRIPGSVSETRDPWE
ncbi:MAG: hypothetical protein M0Z80_08675 [Treponema sp.]|nr:hypothetical protein [Treponema sp.]